MVVWKSGNYQDVQLAIGTPKYKPKKQRTHQNEEKKDKLKFNTRKREKAKKSGVTALRKGKVKEKNREEIQIGVNLVNVYPLLEIFLLDGGVVQVQVYIGLRTTGQIEIDVCVKMNVLS